MDIDTMSAEVTPETSVDTTTTTELSPQVNDAVPVEMEFTPNYKYKAYGKEYEVDEWARPLINKDNQEHLTKLYEKSGGFDHLKTNFKELEQRYTQTDTTYKQLDNVRQAILTNIDRGDLGKAFNLIGLNDDQIMNYVKQKLEYSQLPADQRAMVDHYRQTVDSKYQMETELGRTRREAEELSVQRHEFELDKTFSNPKYSPLIADYNTRVGDENAFRGVIQQIGASEFYSTGRHMPVEEATERALKMLALNPIQAMQMSQDANMGNPPMNANPAGIQTQARPIPKPIMRVGKGSSVAPIAQQPQSISDLKNIYQQEYGA